MNNIIETLLEYAVSTHLMNVEDVCYARNRILALLKEDQYVITDERVSYHHVSELLDELCDYAFKKGVIEESQAYHDAFDSALMDCVMMRPSQLIDAFHSKKSTKEATDMFYAYAIHSNYIRLKRIEKNIQWKVDTAFGKLDITINCSKPEKDPHDIARAKNMVQSAYPTCVLCKENEGFYGNASRDGRSNIRLIPLTLHHEPWYFQYSPYVYYNEHCIVLSAEHVPMQTSHETFVRLLDFVHEFPHYFLGANADLPIVGGSILSHDHYQGGSYTFAMADAAVLETYDVFEKLGVQASRLYWPLSVLRLSSTHRNELIKAADSVLRTWRAYSDEQCDIIAYTHEAHNTISTIARKRGDTYELDLVLRNNRANKEHPLGIFHPHEEIHHIKKENIGIIEVMGLAVLPARLKDELQWMEDAILHDDMTHSEELQPHKEWMTSLKERYVFTEENIGAILREETGNVFVEGLKHCGVYKLDELGKAGFRRFMETIKKEDTTYGD